MKKFLSIFLIIAVIVSFSACSEKEEVVEQEKTPKEIVAQKAEASIFTYVTFFESLEPSKTEVEAENVEKVGDIYIVTGTVKFYEDNFYWKVGFSQRCIYDSETGTAEIEGLPMFTEKTMIG